MTLVMKFGGTSVGSAAAMRDTARLIQDNRPEWPRQVVVVSGIGSRPVKVTDLLLQGAFAALSGRAAEVQQIADQLRQIHFEAIDGLLAPEGERQQILAENERHIDRFASLCEAVLVLGELTPRALDAIAGMGEQMSAPILAAFLRQRGFPAEAVDATELIVTDDNFQSAAPLVPETRSQTQARLCPLLAGGILPVVTGFVGATSAGITTTLGRGGSDYSAAILGQALDAAEVWIWTDVDGVMTADPRLVSGARSIPSLSYREVSELAYYGARVLHPKTIRPCIDSNIPLRIKNTFNPGHPGTVIVPGAPNGGARLPQGDTVANPAVTANGAIKAVTAIEQLSLITVEGTGMIGVPGIAARTFGAVARKDVSVLLISQASSEQSICFAAPESATQEVLASLKSEFDAELQRQDIDTVWAQQPVSIVTIVGAGMRGTPGIAGRIFSALGQHHLNVIAIAQGSSECSISIVVDSQDTAAAVNHIHDLINSA